MECNVGHRKPSVLIMFKLWILDDLLKFAVGDLVRTSIPFHGTIQKPRVGIVGLPTYHLLHTDIHIYIFKA